MWENSLAFQASKITRVTLRFLVSSIRLSVDAERSKEEHEFMLCSAANWIFFDTTGNSSPLNWK